MKKTNTDNMLLHLNDIVYDSIFYQHKHRCYYLTPQQYEQLTWREAAMKRRRDCDVDIGLQILKRNREVSSESNEHIHLMSVQECREDTETCPIDWTESYEVQRRLRQKEEEREFSFNQLLAPNFFQIKRNVRGHQSRFPVIVKHLPCRSYKQKKSCLIRINEEGLESGPSQ
jgi:hypothetical protein